MRLKRSSSAWNSPQAFGKETGAIGDQRKNLDYIDYKIIKINDDTEKRPDVLRRLAVTQTPVKYYNLKLEWNTRKE